MNLFSEAFESGEQIPVVHTCEGENVSPPLAWNGVPEGAKSLVLIVDDPDAPSGIFSHWILYNIQPEQRRLDRGILGEEESSEVGMQGRNDLGNLGYEGPCPPRGPEHHYYFRLFALDDVLAVTPGATRGQIFDEMEGHVVEQTELIGRFGRTV